MSETVLGRSHLDRILEALLKVPGLGDSHTRDVHVEDLQGILRRPIDVKRSPDSRYDLSLLINACNAYSGGIRAFTRLVQRQHPGEASSRAVALADDIVGPALLSAPDREALRSYLTGIAIEQVAEAIGGFDQAAGVGSLDIWRDIPAAIRIIERLPVPDDGVPPLLTFVNRLAHLVTGARSDDLRRWVDATAGGLGVDAAALAQLRDADERAAADPAPPATSQARAARSAHGEPASPRPRRPEEAGLIWGGVPIRNRNFTGRVTLLDRLAEALRTTSKASVLPQTLHGMGGVGKTQLVVEYVYRHLDQYDLVWWIPAEQTSTVLTSLTQLAERLGLATSDDRQQTARAVLDALAGGELSWLLVYDNADDPDTLDQLVPSTGGHVILTTRLQEWATVGPAIEVDVFERQESVELLRKRSQDDQGNPRILTSEASELADKLGDLPLALEQAVAWYLATAMPVKEYIELLDSHIEDLLSEGKPASYPLSVAAFVALAVKQLRETAPATAQLFELFAYLGGEPVPVSLLRHGKDADITEPLRSVLGQSIPMNRIVRDLNRFGLAKVDVAQRVQVHRLVQRVLREIMPADRAQQTLRNARNLLARANPGDPDEQGEHARQREIGPHIEPADMVHAENLDARQVVLDHARYLYITGDYENSRGLALQAVAAWEPDTSHPRLGPDGEFTLRARAHIANATRTLGDSAEAARLIRDTYDRFQRSPLFGPRHEFTLITGNQVAADIRISGNYREALEFDRESVALHREVFGPGETYTLRAQSNLAVDHRMIGDFAEAFALDKDIASHWEDVGGTDWRALEAYMNMARSYYGMGAYRAGIEVLERWRPVLQEILGPGHRLVLLAGRTYGITLRKAGRLAEAAEVISEHQELAQSRFGSNHEFSVAAAMSHANVLRELGDLDAAMGHVADALVRYRTDFGERHPLTLVAQVNEAIVRRAGGEVTEAKALDEWCLRELTRALTSNHPYTLCAGASLATDHALLGDHEAAVRLSTQVLELSQVISGGGHEARDGAEHPYLLIRAINLSHDLRATGATDEADRLLEKSLTGLRLSLGTQHPEVEAAERGERLEGDIEPPPT